MAAVIQRSFQFELDHATGEIAFHRTLWTGIDPKALNMASVRVTVLLYRATGSATVGFAARSYNLGSNRGIYSNYGNTYGMAMVGNPQVYTVDISAQNGRMLDFGLQYTGAGQVEGEIEISIA